MSKSERADDLFILETLRNWKMIQDELEVNDYIPRDEWVAQAIDNDRCIKILEDRKSERVRG